MEPTESMKAYIDIDRQIKALDAQKKKLRPGVLKEFKDNPDILFEGITMSKVEKIDFIYPNFYNWVKENFPEHLQAVTKKQIDEEEFGKLHALGEIEYEEIPEDLYSYKEEFRITVRKVK